MLWIFYLYIIIKGQYDLCEYKEQYIDSELDNIGNNERIVVDYI